MLGELPMKTKAKPKKRNPQDVTLRNINALKKRVTTLEVLMGSVLRVQMVNNRLKGK